MQTMNKTAQISPVLLAIMLASVAAGTPFSQAGERYDHVPPADYLPKQLDDIGIDVKLGSQIPLNLPFRAETGQYVYLSDLIEDRKPILVTLNYSDCPMLCNTQLNGLVEGLNGLNWTAGKEFKIITICINPYEPFTQMAQTKQNYLKEYDRADAKKGWTFLIGKEKNIKTLADSLGYRYKFDPLSKEYLHTAGIFVLTPTGKISNILYGVKYTPEHLKEVLFEAADGKIGSPMEQIIMNCVRYDPEKGSYVLQTRNLMKLGGALTVLVLFGWLLTSWIRDYRRGRQQELEKQGKAQAGAA
jgi:protein SCO1